MDRSTSASLRVLAETIGTEREAAIRREGNPFFFRRAPRLPHGITTNRPVYPGVSASETRTK